MTGGAWSQDSFLGRFRGDGAGAAASAPLPDAAWDNGRVAFRAPVHVAPPGDLVIAGEYIPDPVDPSSAPPLARVAALYREHGMGMGARLSGIFALAIYETGANRLTLLRDPCGARTLYYTLGPDGACWFALRLRTLSHAPSVRRELSLPALRDYLTCAFVPGERTMWKNIYELRPGSALVLPGAGKRTYWTPLESANETAEAPLEAYAARLRPVLEDAVYRRLPPDENTAVGASLSGGVDSSLVVALAAKARGGERVHTYSIHFGPGFPNELRFSDLVAAHCGTRHTVLELPIRLIQKHLEETHALLDDPIGDPLTVPNLLMSRHAAREVGILLNGEGGDPIFGGPKNGPMLLHELYGDPSDEQRIDAYFRSYQKCYDDLGRLLTPAVRDALQGEVRQNALLLPYLGDNAPMRHYLNRLMQINVLMKGSDQILTKINNLTGACGLLGLSPLFDVRVAEAGFAIPPAYKREGAEEKTILKRAIADLLPSPIVTRPKSGMLVPVQKWFKEDLNRYARGMLLSKQSRIRPYIRQEVVREWLDYRPAPLTRQGVKLWLVLALELWLRANDE